LGVADLYSDVRVELPVVRGGMPPPRRCDVGADDAPAKIRFFQERSVREPMTPDAAACPP
jgi:hypothetical protein